MSETYGILEELLRVLDWIEHLVGEETDTNDVVSEDECSENISILSIFLLCFFAACTARHQLHNMQDVVEQL